ncbi:uncharacterized protein NPIL_581221 [Nephila pilipes]|uniref:Uncharacterized protein n=1 Tax=Nephila pilipes TaxID=299642 RepID=A0A8X6N470_NEPPI|nr:uncharacterized protein NPIL_581221 [Nephila pilipes]
MGVKDWDIFEIVSEKLEIKGVTLKGKRLGSLNDRENVQLLSLFSAACDSPDPNSSVFHPIISYDVKIISDNSSISSFVSAFVKEAYNSDTLSKLFDVGNIPATAFRHFAYEDFKKVIYDNNLPNAETIAKVNADFATRPISQNFKVIPRDVMIRIYANIAANYINSIGKLTSQNAESLAKKYANDTKETAKMYEKNGDVESQFNGIAQGLVNFVISLQKLTPDLSWKTGFLFESQYLLAAVEVGGSNDIYDKCAKEVKEQNKNGHIELPLLSKEGGSPVNAQPAAKSFLIIRQNTDVHGLFLLRRNSGRSDLTSY